MQTSYTNTVILLGDDNMKNVFCLVKNNPTVVGMHGFVAFKRLAFCTGITFGDVYSSMNFIPLAVTRTQFAEYLLQTKQKKQSIEHTTLSNK